MCALPILAARVVPPSMWPRAAGRMHRGRKLPEFSFERLRVEGAACGRPTPLHGHVAAALLQRPQGRPTSPNTGSIPSLGTFFERGTPYFGGVDIKTVLLCQGSDGGCHFQSDKAGLAFGLAPAARASAHMEAFRLSVSAAHGSGMASGDRLTKPVLPGFLRSPSAQVFFSETLSGQIFGGQVCAVCLLLDSSRLESPLAHQVAASWQPFRPWLARARLLKAGSDVAELNPLALPRLLPSGPALLWLLESSAKSGPRPPRRRRLPVGTPAMRRQHFRLAF